MQTTTADPGQGGAAQQRSASPERAEQTSASTKVREDVERSLHTRSTQAETAAREVEDRFKRGAALAWRLLRRHPYLGTVAIGAGVVGLAGAIGVAELGAGAVAAYAAYQVLRGRESPDEAARDVVNDVERAA